MHYNTKSAIKNIDLIENFSKNGFVKTDITEKKVLANLKKLADEHLQVKSGYFNYSLMELSPEKNVLLHTKIVEILQPLLIDLFHNYKVLSASFLVKPANFNEEMLLHQDWTFTDESAYMPVTIWIPLQKVNSNNGALFFIPGSHLLFKNFRSFDYETLRAKSENFKSEMTNIDVNENEVVLFHPAIFHGSFANKSNKHRLVVSATILPQEAPYWYIKKKNDCEASIQFLNEDSFFFNLRKDLKSSFFDGYNTIDIEYTHKVVADKDLIQLMKH
jgi:ectoine hydroxylase-related dioxygenase (phytanoyl-CoA dioxygenase family)